MRSFDEDTLAALQSRALVARNFITILGKTLDSPPEEARFSFWNGLDTVEVTVVDGETGADETYEYVGSGVALEIDDIPLTSDISTRTISASLSQIHEGVADAARGADLRGAKVEIHRGLFNVATNVLVAKPICRFIGTVDKCIINTPPVGGKGSIELTLASHTRELTRVNPDVCSDESQQRRHAGDRFYKDVGVVGNWPLFWGREHGPPKNWKGVQDRVFKGRR